VPGRPIAILAFPALAFTCRPLIYLPLPTSDSWVYTTIAALPGHNVTHTTTTCTRDIPYLGSLPTLFPASVLATYYSLYRCTYILPWYSVLFIGFGSRFATIIHRFWTVRHCDTTSSYGNTTRFNAVPLFSAHRLLLHALRRNTLRTVTYSYHAPLRLLRTPHGSRTTTQLRLPPVATAAFKLYQLCGAFAVCYLYSQYLRHSNMT